MKSMVALIVGLIIVAGSIAAMPDDEAKKPPFYLALANMSRDGAQYTFMLDQMLAARCGKAPSIDYLKKVSQSQILVLQALAAGKSDDAKSVLASIPCEGK